MAFYNLLNCFYLIFSSCSGTRHHYRSVGGSRKRTSTAAVLHRPIESAGGNQMDIEWPSNAEYDVTNGRLARG